MSNKKTKFIISKKEIWDSGVSAGYPDIDTDVDGKKRDELVEYLIEKYGKDYVSFVGTRSEYSSKSAIRDLGNVYNAPSGKSIECTKIYNDKLTVEENIKIKPEVKKYFDQFPDMITQVDKFKGVISNVGIHAGGVIISDENHPIKEFCALQKPADDAGRVATMWDKKEIEQLGFVKYDILGLSSCAQIHRARELIGLDPYENAPEDIEVFRDIVINNKNKNIFQFETYLGAQALADFLPMSTKDVSNATSIIRVIGSKEGRQLYAKYKDNVEEVQQGNTNYWKEQLRDEILEDRNYEICVNVLSDSYGVLIFQEQVAQLISSLSGGKLTFGHGDIFRRALEKHGKKFGSLDEYQGNKESLKKWYDAIIGPINEYLIPYLGEDANIQDVQSFLNFELDNNDCLITPKSGILSWILSSAAYLFNKLHAVAYSVNTYNMMWLKHYYPLEFWTASLQLEIADLDKVRNYMSAVRVETDGEIQVTRPDINKSDVYFTMDKKTNEIRYGLKGILNLNKSSQIIVDERKLNGDFKSIQDFVIRIKGKGVNKKVIFNLVSVNAFKDFGTQEEVYNEFLNNGIELNNLEMHSTRQAELESKLLGGNISFTHPIMNKAGLYMPLTELEDGTHDVVALRILKEYNKQTKTGKSYKMFKVECLNSGKTVNLFDWQNTNVESDYLIVRVKNSKGWYTMLGLSNKKFNYNKKNLRKLAR